MPFNFEVKLKVFIYVIHLLSWAHVHAAVKKKQLLQKLKKQTNI